MRIHKRSVQAFALVLLMSLANPAAAQDIEPRRWSDLPMNLNILGVGTAATEGDIYFNPVMQIEDGR